MDGCCTVQRWARGRCCIVVGVILHPFCSSQCVREMSGRPWFLAVVVMDQYRPSLTKLISLFKYLVFLLTLHVCRDSDSPEKSVAFFTPVVLRWVLFGYCGKICSSWGLKEPSPAPMQCKPHRWSSHVGRWAQHDPSDIKRVLWSHIVQLFTEPCMQVNGLYFYPMLPMITLCI